MNKRAHIQLVDQAREVRFADMGVERGTYRFHKLFEVVAVEERLIIELLDRNVVPLP